MLRIVCAGNRRKCSAASEFLADFATADRARSPFTSLLIKNGEREGGRVKTIMASVQTLLAARSAATGGGGAAGRKRRRRWKKTMAV